MAKAEQDSEKGPKQSPAFVFVKTCLLPAIAEEDISPSWLLEKFNKKSDQDITPQEVLDELKNRIVHKFDPRGLSPIKLVMSYRKLALDPNLQEEINPIVVDTDYLY